MTQATVTCCYCNRELTLQGQTRHQERCVKSPDMSAKVREFVRNYHETHGRITSDEYRSSPERKAAKLPDDTVIWATFKSWKRFVEWCGIKYVRTSKRMTPREISEAENFKRIDAMLAEGKAALETAYDFRAIPAIDRGVKRLYDPCRMTYYEAHVMELR